MTVGCGSISQIGFRLRKDRSVFIGHEGLLDLDQTVEPNPASRKAGLSFPVMMDIGFGSNGRVGPHLWEGGVVFVGYDGRWI